MSSQVYGGTGGGACAGCGGFPPNCRCPEQAEAHARERGAILGLQEQLHHIDEKLKAIYAERVPLQMKLNAYKRKCPTCRCKILPGSVCSCCAEPTCVDDLPYCVASGREEKER